MDFTFSKVSNTSQVTLLASSYAPPNFTIFLETAARGHQQSHLYARRTSPEGLEVEACLESLARFHPLSEMIRKSMPEIMLF